MILWRNFQDQFTCCCLLYVGLRFVLLSISLFHYILLSVIPHHIHNENSCANVLFWAVHELGCHIIFQSWTWRWWDIWMGVRSLRSAVRFRHRFATTSEKHLHSSALKYVNMVGVERWGYLFIIKVTDVYCIVILWFKRCN